eukprot:6178576-Pleurochrysis_carterae.AAC.2
MAQRVTFSDSTQSATLLSAQQPSGTDRKPLSLWTSFRSRLVCLPRRFGAASAVRASASQPRELYIAAI